MPLARLGDIDDLSGRPHAEAAPTGCVRLGEPVVDDGAPGGKVGAWQHGHELLDVGFGRTLGHHQLDGVVDLARLCRRHVGGHADGDAGGAVDQQVRQPSRQVDRLLALAVEGGRNSTVSSSISANSSMAAGDSRHSV
jgi:hypothetical protein